MATSGEKIFTGDDQSLQEQPQVELATASQVDTHPLQVERSNASGKGNQNCGYECEFVQPPPEALQTDCSICLLVLREPHLISCCGHNFCQVCIGRIKTDGKSCPLCNATDFTLMHNKGLERSLKEFDVRCTYATRGCEWVGKLGLLDNHLNLNSDLEKQLEGCSFVEIACNHRCGGVFSRHMLANHQGEECPKRPYSCDYCRDYASTFEDVINNHWPECKCYPLSCPNQCTPYAIERQHIADHLSNNCPFAVVNCDFHYAGCEVQLPRKDMPAHLRENFTHVSLLAAMNQKLTERLLKKDEEIDQLGQELKEMMAKLDKKEKEHQQQLEQEISDLTKKHDENVHELKEESTIQRQEIDILKQKQDEATTNIRAEKAALKQEIQHEMYELKQKQVTDTQSLVRDMTDMREKQEQDRTELERQATGLLHVNAHIGLVPFQITMPDFETHKAAADEWYSEPFYTHPGGYKMCLKVVANGIGEGEVTHISVCVVLMRGTFDEHLKWPLLCDITIELLNQKENEGHRRKAIAFGDSKDNDAFRVTRGDKAKDGWGEPQFISHADLYRPRDDFINYGCIRFQITKIEHRN